MLRDAQGRTRYTRAGQFQWNADGVLVTRGEPAKVLGQRSDGTLGEISNAGLRSTGGHATTTVRLTGNLSSTLETQTVGSLQVFDTAGGAHNLSLQFTSLGSDRWKLELSEAGQSIGTAEMAFVDGRPTEASRRPSFTYTPAGQPAQTLVLDLSSDVTSFASGSLSSLGMASQDGTGPGVLTRLAFDARGTLVASYSNGQTVNGPRLVLGRFGSDSAVQSLGENQFGEANGIAWEHGLAGEPGFASVQAGSLEMSNVDLTREFSDLVVMQRGYQASSQVVSTANEMLQELFGMKNK
jgi:flagellar hook protein FlgE